jgi:hypothetical protein
VISVNNTKKIIGSFRDEIDAAKAYDKAAKLYYREFAILNFPNDSSTSS